MTRLVLILALCALPLPALAHKVIASVFPSGDGIEGEIGFSNGAMASGETVTVFGPDGAELGTTVTDADGFFTFTPAQPVAHRFHANLGAGHIADVTMPAEEVAAILGQEPLVPETPKAAAESPSPTAPMTDQQRAILAEIVRDEMRPLRREIAAYREKNDLQSILGGIGYIAGLFGLGFYLAARRKLKDAA